MKKLFVAISISLFALSTFAQEEKVKGIYYNTEKTAKIKIFLATNGKYYGKLVWLEDPEKKDINNPDPKKRNEPRLGMLLIKGFDYSADEDKWIDGTIYDPENGKTYDCFMWFDGDNYDKLHVKGYVMGMRFAGREVEWERTEL